MNVHNLMEEFVIKNVNKMYDQLKTTQPPWFTCDCENCRMDAISYVLNRIPPKYVVSGRGVIHNTLTLNDNQLAADLDAISLEAIRTVNSVKRPNHNNMTHKMPVFNGPVFNFPLFTGSIFDGTTFEPLVNASIALKQNGSLVEMIDQTWNNPCLTYKATKGTYSFWVKPIPSKKTGETKHFTFTVELDSKGYEHSTYNFEVPVTSEEGESIQLNSTYSLKIQDLFLFSNDIKNPME